MNEATDTAVPKPPHMGRQLYPGPTLRWGALVLSRIALVVVAIAVVALPGRFALADPFAVRTFSPWQGYAIPNGLWLTGDFAGTHLSGVVHVVQGSDAVNVWTSKG